VGFGGRGFPAAGRPEGNLFFMVKSKIDQGPLAQIFVF